MKNSVEVVKLVRKWLESFVIELNLCPFAKAELLQERIRFAVCESQEDEQLLTALYDEIVFLKQHPEIATTLVIHPSCLTDFDDYNQFLELTNALLEQQDWVGEYQVASFHPDYQFAGTQVNDAENYTNRSPYPMLHILRESMVEKAVEHHPDVGQIPIKNIELMQQIGSDQLQAQLYAILDTKNT